jgi:hypothetical protein
MAETRLAPAGGGVDLRPPTPTAAPTAYSQIARRRRFIPILIVTAAAIYAGALLWSRAGYVPIWDGRIYAECYIDAATHAVRLEGFRCGNHVSHAYAAIISLIQRAAPSSTMPMLAANALLFALAAGAFWRILRRLLPDPMHATARALTTAAFLVHPVVLAAVIQPGLDFGLFVFSLLLIAAAVESRLWGVAVAGSLLVFTKEPGLIIYAVVATFYVWRAAVPASFQWPIARSTFLAAGALLLVYNIQPLHPAVLPAAVVVSVGVLLIGRPRGFGKREVADLGRRVVALWPIAAPLVLFGAYAAYRVVTHMAAPGASGTARVPVRANVLWGSDSAQLLVDMFLRLEADPFAASALALVFVVGFLWVPSAIVAVDGIVGAVRGVRRLAARAVPGASTELVTFVAAMTGTLAWALTRYETFSNARYYLPVYPLVLIVACCALVRLGVPRRAREGAIALIVVLLAASTTRTVDPVSRWLWGTFPFGDRALLHVTSITGECCGYGRDQLAYNLEFTAFAAVQDELYARIRPTDKTVFVMHDYADLYTVGALDARTRRRTLRRTDIVRPAVVKASLAAVAAQMRLADDWTAWFLEFPNMDHSAYVAPVRRRFDVGPPVWAKTRDGYAMAAYPLRERLPAPASASP